MVGIEGSHEWKSAREAKEFFMAPAGRAGRGPEVEEKRDARRQVGWMSCAPRVRGGGCKVVEQVGKVEVVVDVLRNCFEYRGRSVVVGFGSANVNSQQCQCRNLAPPDDDTIRLGAMGNKVRTKVYMKSMKNQGSRSKSYGMLISHPPANPAHGPWRMSTATTSRCFADELEQQSRLYLTLFGARRPTTLA